MSAIQHFILVFDRAQGRLIDTDDFGSDGEAAVARYSELEREHQDSPHIDIVLVGSDSLETVKKTHANYFDVIEASQQPFVDAVSKYLTGVGAPVLGWLPHLDSNQEPTD